MAPKHIGIVACSAEGAALCYRTICVEGTDILGPHTHPEVSMHTHSLGEYMQHVEAGGWEGVANLMLDSAQKLARIGAEFLICPDNTLHQAFPYLTEKSPLPWLHIAEVVADTASRREHKHLAILGTKYLMESNVYPEKLQAKEIRYSIPQPQEREKLNSIIFDELVYGRFTRHSRGYFQSVINRMRSEGCDAAVLGCTEIPLLISQEDSSLPVLDSTRLLARAALRHACA